MNSSQIIITMPALSPTMTSGKISKWCKNIGDKICMGDVLVEIETDKAVMEYESEHAGVFEAILEEAGSVVKVGQPIAWIQSKKANFTETSPISISNTTKEKGNITNNNIMNSLTNLGKNNKHIIDWRALRNSGIIASPAAKNLISINKIDPATIKGTGLSGRITLRDIISFLSNSDQISDSNQELSYLTGYKINSTNEAFSSLDKEEIFYQLQKSNSQEQKNTDSPITPMSPMRLVIAERLSWSKRSIPHYYLEIEPDITEMLKIRAQINEINPTHKISVNDMLVKASALALAQTPEVNLSFVEPNYIQKRTEVDVAIAVSVQGGLITPIVKDADKKLLPEISKEIRSLAEKAKNKKLQPQEYEGGRFTISNLGMYGIKRFYSIINPPQPFILAVGASHKVGDRDIICITMSADHRILDGVESSKYLANLNSILSNPLKLFF